MPVSPPGRRRPCPWSASGPAVHRPSPRQRSAAGARRPHPAAGRLAEDAAADLPAGRLGRPPVLLAHLQRQVGRGLPRARLRGDARRLRQGERVRQGRGGHRMSPAAR
ncbi:hypothetical protein SGPA1_11789 [Streptomyces misionensis JCM 4497]